MGAWVQDPSPLLPYVRESFPTIVMALEPDRWFLQAQPGGYIRFDRGLAKVMGIHLTDGDPLVLPALGIPIRVWPTRISAIVLWKWTSLR